MLFMSAKTGAHVEEILPLALSLHEQASVRIGTGELNRAVRDAADRRAPRSRAGKTPHILYATQISVQPPTFVIFVNEPSLFTPAYERFLATFLRKQFPMSEVPLRLYFRARRRSRGKERGEGRTAAGKQ